MMDRNDAKLRVKRHCLKWYERLLSACTEWDQVLVTYGTKFLTSDNNIHFCGRTRTYIHYTIGEISDVKNMVPLKVAYYAALTIYEIKFLSLGNVKNLIPFPTTVSNSE